MFSFCLLEFFLVSLELLTKIFHSSSFLFAVSNIYSEEQSINKSFQEELRILNKDHHEVSSILFDDSMALLIILSSVAYLPCLVQACCTSYC